MNALLFALAALAVKPPPPRVQIFTERHAAWCAKAFEAHARLATSPADRKAWLARCAEDSVDAVRCVIDAATPEQQAACDRSSPYPSEVQRCIAKAAGEPERAACKPDAVCADAVDIMTEVASADPELSDSQRAAAVKVLTATRSRSAEVAACIRLPSAVRRCAEAASSVDELTSCVRVESSWSERQFAPHHPFTQAFDLDCEAAKAAWPRLYTAAGHTEALVCDGYASDTLRCLAEAAAREGVDSCLSEATVRCRRAFDAIVFRNLAPDIRPELRAGIEESLADERRSFIAQCRSLPSDLVQCLETSERPFSLDGCVAAERCAGLSQSLQRLLARDAMLGRAEKARHLGLLLDESAFQRVCAGARRSALHCVAGAQSWSDAMTCTRPAP